MFEWTDDLSDPCPYCVGWDESVDPAIPVRADGTVAVRVSRIVHDDCERDVIAYLAESRE